MNLAVLTCTTKNREWLYKLTNPTKEKYCNKFGYKFIFDTDIYPDKTMKPGWNKIPFILNYLKKFDYIVWIDDDAGFISYKNDILEKTIIESNNKSIIICKDFNGINSGVMIIKNTEFSNYMFNTIWDNRILYKNDSHGHPGNMEQPAIIDFCNIFTDQVYFANGHVLNAYDKIYCDSKPNNRDDSTYILHIANGIWKNEHKELISNIFNTI